MAVEELDESLIERGKEAGRKASKEEMEGALEHASAFIDTLPFYGEKLNASQGLAWPRKGVADRDGKPIVGVPEEIKNATYMVAGFILAGIPFNEESLAWVFLTIGHLVREDHETPDRPVTWH